MVYCCRCPIAIINRVFSNRTTHIVTVVNVGPLTGDKRVIPLRYREERLPAADGIARRRDLACIITNEGFQRLGKNAGSL